MKLAAKIDMAEALRLIRDGRLNEALALLSGGGLTARSASSVDTEPGSPLNLSLPEQSHPATKQSSLRSFIETTFDPTKFGGPTIPSFPKKFRGLLGACRPVVRGQFEAPPAGFPARRPPPVPDGATFEEKRFANSAGNLAYKIYIPSGYVGTPLPLVIMLHGCTQSADDFAVGTRMNDLAEEQNFLVAYPEQAHTANISRCWNWFRTSDQQRDLGEPSLIAGITREIMRTHRVEPGRVYVAGLSAGGAAAAVMGQTYPELYAAVGVHSGLACGAATDASSAFAAMQQGGSPTLLRRRSWASEPIPTIVFHGDQDAIVTPTNGDQVIAQSKSGADLRTNVSRGEAPGGIRFTRTIYEEKDGHPVLEQWVLHGAAHAWSGGNAAGSYTEPRGPDASREMLRFFRHHTALSPR